MPQTLEHSVVVPVQVVPELQSPSINENPILKADAIKFVTTFRCGGLAINASWTARWLDVRVCLGHASRRVCLSGSVWLMAMYGSVWVMLRVSGRASWGGLPSGNLAPYASPQLLPFEF